MDRQYAPDMLLDFLAECFNNPEYFVDHVFGWGEGELAGHNGPDIWQRETLQAIGEELKKGAALDAALRIAIASGHGIGKTALVAWIILWAMSTRPNLAGVVTANTAPQLSDKTWRELSVWHKRLLHKAWFEWTATKFYQIDNPETWFVAARAWTKERSEAFAGLHAKYVLVIYDEASAIDEKIWEVSEGAMTTSGAMWLVFGNPTRNTGKFHGCFHAQRHRWIHRQIDSRSARMANQKQILEWINDYGEDSDFVRIRVRGIFPRAGSNQLIPGDLVEQAAKRSPEPSTYLHAARIIGVDVARSKEGDQSVLIRRQGLHASGLRKWRGLDTMTYAGIIAEEIEAWKPDRVFIDMGGIGAGVFDRLVQLGYHNTVTGVDFGGSAGDSKLHKNKRTQMWCLMGDWLITGAIPPDSELMQDLPAPEYGFTGDSSQIYLEKKEDMKKRGLSSPDCGDALALTFAMPVAPADWQRESNTREERYDPRDY